MLFAPPLFPLQRPAGSHSPATAASHRWLSLTHCAYCSGDGVWCVAGVCSLLCCGVVARVSGVGSTLGVFFLWLGDSVTCTPHHCCPANDCGVDCSLNDTLSVLVAARLRGVCVRASVEASSAGRGECVGSPSNCLVWLTSTRCHCHGSAPATPGIDSRFLHTPLLVWRYRGRRSLRSGWSTFFVLSC